MRKPGRGHHGEGNSRNENERENENEYAEWGTTRGTRPLCFNHVSAR